MKLRSFTRNVVLLVVSWSLTSCKDTRPTGPGSEVRPRSSSASGMTSADSADFLSESVTHSLSAVSATLSTIQLEAGDSILVSVQSTDCSGNPETVSVSGVISGVVVSGSCLTLPGTTVKLGPATVAGTVSFRASHHFYGQGPVGDVSGSFPAYVVGMNDGYGDTDYNDVIIDVQVIFYCPPSNDPIIDHRDFRSRYDSLMKASKVDSAVGSRREWGMTVVLDPNAPSGIRINWPQILGTQCEVSIPYDPLALADIHSHPYWDGEANPCTSPVPFIPDHNGGGSSKDWIAPYPGYVATPKWLFKLDPSTPERDRWKNPWRYEVTKRGCFVRNPIFPF